MRLLRARDRLAQTWKNGGGVTREVWVSPHGSGFEDFEWRVSIAEVRESGPFSIFAGIDRTMAILEGRLRLTFDARAVELTAQSAPIAFSGDEPVSGEPIDGPVTDLNVMVRRGVCRARLARAPMGPLKLPEKAGLVLAVAPVSVAWGAETYSLAPRDALLLEEAAVLHLDGAAFAISIARC